MIMLNTYLTRFINKRIALENKGIFVFCIYKCRKFLQMAL